MSDDHGRLIKVTHPIHWIVAEKDAEIDALKADLADARRYCTELAGEIARLRAAVSAGTDPATGLTGENLRDSGMRQAGGVSDGPQ